MQQFFYVLVLLLVLASPGVQAGRLSPLPTNRSLDVLKGRVGGSRNRRLFWQAGTKLGDWTIHIADVKLDGPFLQMLAKKDRHEPFTRIVREATGLPLDVDDFIYFVDDVLRAKRRGLRAKSVWLNPVKARKTGVLLDTGDVFKPIQKRLYGRFSFDVYTARSQADEASKSVDDDPQADDSQAGDSQADEAQADTPPVVPAIESLSRKERLLGAHWAQYYTDPTSEDQMLEALQKAQRSPDFVDRIRMLLRQLREQGAVVGVHSTVRDNRRGYLMWGAYLLSRSHTKDSVKRAARRLRVLNRKWDLNIPIRWYHPAGRRETTRLARQMVNAFDVAFATPHGAHRSKHYNGEAIDFTAIALPRTLKLRAPDSQECVFDLSAAQQSRDLNLTPELVDWIEVHFGFSKLRNDYPHWDDNSVQLIPLTPEPEFLGPPPEESDLLSKEDELSKNES